MRVRLYADIPYLLRHGPPTWLGGADPRADAQVERAFAAIGAQPVAFDRHLVRLTTEQTRRKIEAFGQYRTEFALVDADFDGATSDPTRMRREVYWEPRPRSDG
jgi:hypothetical protein